MRRNLPPYAGLLIAAALAAPLALAEPPTHDPGLSLFESKGCIACHGEGGVALDKVSIYADEDIIGVFESPPAGMPVFDLTEQEQTDLIAYLRRAHAVGVLAPKHDAK